MADASEEFVTKLREEFTPTDTEQINDSKTEVTGTVWDKPFVDTDGKLKVNATQVRGVLEKTAKTYFLLEA